VTLQERLQEALGASYTLDHELGGGGMSHVFVARDNALGRRVVVKVLRPELVTGVAIERFQREIHLAATLQHPHIVPVLAAGSVDEVPFYIMPFVSGESLRSRITEAGALPVAEAIRTLRDIASALAHAHGQGVVHRDIKPDNVMLSGGVAVVTDFGVAKAMAAAATGSGAGEGALTSIGIALGTLAYMSPEQVSADPDVDDRSDIYSFGCVAYEMLTGGSPFAGLPAQQLLAAHLTETPVPVESRNGAVPRWLAALVRRCLEKSPAARPQSAAELLAELDSTAVRIGGADAVRPGIRRHPFTILAAAGLLVMIGAAAMWDPRCPDGSSRFLGGCGARGAASLHPNRLAILPFRTSGADPALEYLRHGLVELLSAEFNGEIGPVAVEPGEALRAWASANAGDEPGATSDAIEVARQLGAGQATHASIVGTPRRFTVTISIIDVRSGEVRSAPVQVQGTEDSLATLVSSLALRLLGRSAGAVSSSDVALRAFAAGMAAYRNGDEPTAVAAFERALEADSTFVLAAFRLVVLRAIYGPSGDIAPIALRTAWVRRHLLSPEQRLLLEALATEDEMLFRAQMLPRLERAIAALQNSPEAWDILGNLYFHVGALTGREDWVERAAHAMRTAMALDSVLAIGSRREAATIAFRVGDVRTVSQLRDESPWNRYLFALLSGDAAAVQTARTEYVRAALGRGNRPWLDEFTLPRGEADSLVATAGALANTELQKESALGWAMLAEWKAGRIRRSRELRNRLYPVRDAGDSAAAALWELLTHEEPYSAPVYEAIVFSQVGRAFAPGGKELCEVALSRLRRSDTTGVASILSAMPRWEPGRELSEMRSGLGHGVNPEVGRIRGQRQAMICREVLAGALSAVAGGDRAALLRADSVMRYMPLNWGDWWNYDIALAFARQGEYAAAASAVRRSWVLASSPMPRRPLRRRQEGRWAALAGDTASAVGAYRQYLSWRYDPDPGLIPQRDSVIAELALLEQSRRRTPSRGTYR
jgi:eukaryotic-like serine/threonine-protein kinase